MFNQKVGQFNPDNNSGEAAWKQAAVSQGVKPQTTQPVSPSTEVTKVGGVGKVLEGNSEAAIASIGARGTLAWDTTMGVNQPVPGGIGGQTQLGRSGTSGGTLRVNA